MKLGSLGKEPNLRHFSVHRPVLRTQATARVRRLRSMLPDEPNAACLLSCVSSPGRSWLEMIPYHRRLRIPDFAFAVGAQLRLGVIGLPCPVPPRHCVTCKQTVHGNDLNHAMSCASFSGARIFRHDLGRDTLRHICSLAGCSSTAEPRYEDLGSEAANQQRGDVSTFLSPGPGRVAVDFAVTNASAPSYATRSATQGHTVRIREGQKTTCFRKHGESGVQFRPFVVDVYGFLGKGAMRFIRELADVACASDKVARGRYMSSTFQQLSVALCIGNGHIARAAYSQSIAAAGHAFLPGRDVPIDTVCD